MRIFSFTLTSLFIILCILAISCEQEEGIIAFLHANVNCSDLDQSIAFYEMLGFSAMMASESTVTAEFAKALDMPPYTLRFAQLIHLDGSIIDLIEWKDPYDATPPYSHVNHLGIARITLSTTNLDADVRILSEKGIEFFSEAASIDRPLGNERFICFKDLDGTIIELVERDTSSDSNLPINITGFLSVNINCSNIEQSRIFYKTLNFKSIIDFEESGSSEVAAAFGLPSYQVSGSTMKLNKGPAINLLEWKDPHNSESPYSKLNHLGIPRIAIQTTDLDAEIERLKAQGIEFFSEPARPDGPLTFLKFVCFKDPDGTVIELVELLLR